MEEVCDLPFYLSHHLLRAGLPSLNLEQLSFFML
jgi:hypothetical protein